MTLEKLTARLAEIEKSIAEKTARLADLKASVARQWADQGQPDPAAGGNLAGLAAELEAATLARQYATEAIQEARKGEILADLAGLEGQETQLLKALVAADRQLVKAYRELLARRLAYQAALTNLATHQTDVNRRVDLARQAGVTQNEVSAVMGGVLSDPEISRPAGLIVTALQGRAVDQADQAVSDES